MKAPLSDRSMELNSRSRRKALVATILMVGLTVALGVGAHSWKEQLHVGEIRVEGNAIVPTKEVLSRAKIDAMDQLFQIDIGAIQERIEENLFIRTASVKRDVRNGITIVIEERKPIAALVLDRLQYVDEYGLVLPPMNSQHIFDIPVITGRLKQEDFRAGVEVNDQRVLDAVRIIVMARGFGDELFRNISEIHLGGDGILLYSAEDGIPIVFGEGQSAEKLVKLAGFWKEIVQPQGAHALKYIDLRFKDQVIVQWKPGVHLFEEKDVSSAEPRQG